MSASVSSAPETFRRALASLDTAVLRPHASLEMTPAPGRLAPCSAAYAAEILPAGSDANELASGRFVVLHDPAGVPAWQGDLRLVTYVRAALEPEMIIDPLLAEVTWTWLL